MLEVVDWVYNNRYIQILTPVPLSTPSTVRTARNDLLPLVTLQYNYQQSGLGRTLDDSFTLLRDNRFTDHSVGIQLQAPIGNQAPRSPLPSAPAPRLQQLTTPD